MQQELYTVMTYEEFDKMASKLLGREYEFIAEFEADNDSDYAFSVSEDDVLSFAPENASDDGVFGVLTALVVAGELQVGNFLITVCW